mmetsp:Transcript_26504/g.58235  ORF Transcript_26504/g.58235 Transcript_26504/m.58235 type:complete len:206 (-) Transcript_26504:37-654(-)
MPLAEALPQFSTGHWHGGKWRPLENSSCCWKAPAAMSPEETRKTEMPSMKLASTAVPLRKTSCPRCYKPWRHTKPAAKAAALTDSPKLGAHLRPLEHSTSPRGRCEQQQQWLHGLYPPRFDEDADVKPSSPYDPLTPLRADVGAWGPIGPSHPTSACSQPWRNGPQGSFEMQLPSFVAYHGTPAMARTAPVLVNGTFPPGGRRPY